MSPEMIRGWLATTLVASVLLGGAKRVHSQAVSWLEIGSRSDTVGERAEVLALALGHRLPGLGEEGADGGPFLIDTLRTATRETDRRELLPWLAARVGAELGNVQDHCVRIRDRSTGPDAELGIPQVAVRPASRVVAVDIVEWGEEEAVVSVTQWQGRGTHTGLSVELRAERTVTGWEIVEHLTSSHGSCIRAPRQPLEVSLTGMNADVLARTEVGQRIFVSFLDSIGVWVEGGLLGIVPEDLEGVVREHGAMAGEVIQISENPLGVRVLLR